MIFSFSHATHFGPHFPALFSNSLSSVFCFPHWATCYWEREEMWHMVPVLYLWQNEHKGNAWDLQSSVKLNPRRCGTILSAEIQKRRENWNLGQSSKTSREDWNFNFDRPGFKILLWVLLVVWLWANNLHFRPQFLHLLESDNKAYLLGFWDVFRC